MLFQWIDHEDLTNKEQLMSVVYDTGMITKQQLQEITGWSFHKLTNAIRDARKLGEPKDSWLRSVYGTNRGNNKMTAAYTLGKKSIKYIQNLRQLPYQPSKEAPESQRGHFLGINNFICRCVESFGRSTLEFYSSYEIGDQLIIEWNDLKQSEINHRHVLRPDGRMKVSNQLDVFFEFDNNTEMARMLEDKFHRYIQFYQELNLDFPVIWVTTDEKRKQFLKKNWEGLLEISYMGQNVPEMHFFLPGEEITWMEQQVNIPPKIR